MKKKSLVLLSFDFLVETCIINRVDKDKLVRTISNFYCLFFLIKQQRFYFQREDYNQQIKQKN